MLLAGPLRLVLQILPACSMTNPYPADIAVMPADIKAILQLEVPIIVQIAERDMTVQEVTSLVPGAIIELPKLSDEELDLMVNNVGIGAGTAVKVGENYGLKVTFIGDLKERIAALGGANDQDQTESESKSEPDADAIAEAAEKATK